jgi:hypothetical protein
MALDSMRAIEVTALEAKGTPPNAARQKADTRILLLFATVVVGVLFSWFWGIGWAYLADTTKPLNIGPPFALLVRFILSIGIAALTFQRTYDAVGKGTAQSSLPALLAFQNGFFWEALLGTIVAQFTGGTTGGPAPSPTPAG